MKNIFPYVIRYWNKNTFYNAIKNMYCSVLFSHSVCMALCNPMNCSIPSFPVLHHLPELAQTHAHWVGDAIQPSHPLSFPSPLPSNLPSIRVFSNESALCIRWPSIGASASASILPMNIQDWFPLGWTALISSCSPRDSQQSSPTPQFKSINSSALSFLHSPTLTSIHDHWKNHSLD